MKELLEIKNTKIYIKKRSFPEWIVFVILTFSFFFSFLTGVLYLPGSIRFLLDVLLVSVLIMFLANKHFIARRKLKPFIALVCLFLAYTAIVYLFNFQSPFYYLWGVRNNFRFYVAFFAFAIYLNEDFANGLLALLDFLFWANAIVSLYQFFFMGIRQDYLGGVFGYSGGTNGYTLLFFIIVIGKSFLKTLSGDEKISLCVFKSIVSLLLAAMAEIKFYYVVFVLLVIITFGLTTFTHKKIVLLIISIGAVFVGSILLTSLFADFQDFLSFENLIYSATKENYSSEGDLNRLSSIPTLMKSYVTDSHQWLFGMGLGNADLSDVSIFNSAFYQKYSFLHYAYFMIAMLFLEVGFVGIFIYIMFFVLCFLHCRKQLKHNVENKLFCQMGILMSIFCIISIFYNASLRTEAGYMAYFVLALPFVESAKPQGDVVENNLKQTFESQETLVGGRRRRFR